MSMLIQHHMAAWNAERQFNITTKAKAKKTEKLSSGYKINRAADDAAGLAISEKMRRQIRGLRQGTENAQDGVSWVQIGEGALNEAHDVLQRMNELTIKAQNGTNTAEDREYIEAEFDQLQTELDRISDTTTFNELPIFEPHEPVYDQICGNNIWDDMEIHEIQAGKNQLVIEYREALDKPQKTLILEVPPGTYTTHELIDALDDAAGLDGPIHMEYMGKGTCNLNLENGEIIDTVSGDLSYLLWDTYNGGGYGALIGTTEYVDGGKLTVYDGKNDYMKFYIEYFDGGGKDEITIDLPGGKYTKEELMKIINNAVPASTGIKATEHGDSIMLSSDKGIVTGFKGNMFDIDGSTYSSVFYDNIQKGYIWQDPAAVVGGAVLTTDSRDEEHSRYYINSSNNTLVLNPNPVTNSVKDPITITIPQKTANANDPTKEGYTALEMVEELNKIFDNTTGLKGEVKAYLVEYKQRVGYPDDPTKPIGEKKTESVGDDSVIFQGVEIRTMKEGPDAIVNIDKAASTAYDTLFTVKNYNTYGTGAADAVVDNQTKADVNASAQSYKTYAKSDTTVATFNSKNNRFNITLRSTAENGTKDFGDITHTINVGTGKKTVSQTVDAINASIATFADFKNRIKAVYKDNRIQIVDKDYADTDDKVLANVTDPYLNWYTTIELDSYGSNIGLQTIFEDSYTYYIDQTKSGKGSLTLDKDSVLGGEMTITINGVPKDFPFNGQTSLEGIRDAINSRNPIRFTSKTDNGSVNGRTVTMNATGETDIPYYAGGKATGESKKLEGSTRFEKNSPATLAIGPELTSDNMTIDSTNNKITIKLNGREETLELTGVNGSGIKREQIVDALQIAIDDTFGTGMGGASVSLGSDNRLHITCNLPRGEDGEDTSVEAFAKGARTNTFFDYICDTKKVETSARATSTLAISNSIALKEGVNDTFTFSYNDSTGNHPISIDLTSVDETIDRTEFLSRIQTGLTGTGVTADLDSSNRLVLSTTEKGNQTSISYSASSSDPNAAVVFSGITNPKKASVTFDKDVKATGSGGTFGVWIDNNYREETIAAWNNSRSNTLAKVINDKFSKYGVTASLNNGKLTLTGSASGTGSIIHIEYKDECTSFKQIFGSEADPGVKASVVGSGNNKQLKITGGKNDIITVSSSTSGGTLKKIAKTGYYSPIESGGFHSPKYSTVTSASLAKYVNDGGIELDKWNNKLEFEFTKNGTAATEADQKWQKVSFKLTESAPGTKTSIVDIVKELQTKMDAALGTNVVEVLFDATTNKLSFKSKKAGAQFQFRGLASQKSNVANDPDKYKMGGGFYHHVMCQYGTTETKLADPTDINGEQYASDIFAQGRHDVIVDQASLHPGISDTLILDLNFIADANHNGKLDAAEKADVKTITIEMKLDTKVEDWLTSSSEEVLQTIRDRLKDAINSADVKKQAADLGVVLHEDLIEVDIGRHNTGIVGNKDKVSISFTLTKNPEIAVPEEGYFYIDGIRGNAAYETFYYTEGELVPAYIIGTKDIRNGVTLGENDSELMFEIDGVLKKVDLSKLERGRKYSAEEVIQAITDEFQAQNLPLAASITQKGALKISFDRMGKHTIEKVTGDARDALFYTEHADKREKKDPYVRVSSSDNDRIDLYSPHFSTTMLRINSCCVSTVKNAEKATERLKKAMSKVSEMRTNFGALQNRLEHTINNNQNKEENTQAAESQIRDADIAKEVMEYSNLNIIQQAGQAILAQANQSRDGMLALLG